MNTLAHGGALLLLGLLLVALLALALHLAARLLGSGQEDGGEEPDPEGAIRRVQAHYDRAAWLAIRRGMERPPRPGQRSR